MKSTSCVPFSRRCTVGRHFMAAVAVGRHFMAAAVLIFGLAITPSASALQETSTQGADGGAERGTQSSSREDTDLRQPLRYATARTGGVTIRNLADVHGLALVDAPEGALLAVYGESAGWLEVDVPGGLPVWVFGRYLREVEGVPGVLEVTNNNVNMRPRAGSDVNNFPLGARLVAGDQVAEIAREDATKPLAETWVQIWAPPGACGWVQAERTTPVAGSDDGREAWVAAEAVLASGLEPKGRGTAARSDPRAGEVREAAAPTPAARSMEQARLQLDRADELFAIERERAAPDFDGLRQAYRAAILPDTGSGIAEVVAQKLATVDALEEIVRTKALLEEERAARRRENERIQREQWQRLRERDPFYGQFAVRGVLESFQDSRGRRTYRISRGAEAQTVVSCSSGRYDLELFVGREIGLDGGFVVVAGVDPTTGVNPAGEAAAFVAGLPSLDVVALEVLR